ncbi:MAG: hypothetical protein ABFS18_14020 [Thermodesulfobacteriota bacterium]
MAPNKIHESIFASDLDNTTDLLHNAYNVTTFLGDAIKYIHDDEALEHGLSKNGSLGLYQILFALENTIAEALKRMDD